MRMVADIAELRAVRAGLPGRVALVPTMGNLHAGHLSLVEAARERADSVAVSIFVNPLQFGPGEDYARYPRTLDEDAAVLSEAGVDLVFAPRSEQMYPRGESATRIAVAGISEELCGEFRPGHFEGVTTVVAMLLNLVNPDLAMFGEKDYQQLILIRRMAADLHWPAEIVGVPTVREADGLAMSSRNQYLSADEREAAPALYAALCEAGEVLRAGGRDYDAIEAAGRRRMQEAGFEPEYFAVRGPELIRPAPDADEFRVLAAGRLGRARLIDNLGIFRYSFVPRIPRATHGGRRA